MHSSRLRCIQIKTVKNGSNTTRAQDEWELFSFFSAFRSDDAVVDVIKVLSGSINVSVSFFFRFHESNSRSNNVCKCIPTLLKCGRTLPGMHCITCQRVTRALLFRLQVQLMNKKLNFSVAFFPFGNSNILVHEFMTVESHSTIQSLGHWQRTPEIE